MDQKTESVLPEHIYSCHSKDTSGEAVFVNNHIDGIYFNDNDNLCILYKEENSKLKIDYLYLNNWEKNSQDYDQTEHKYAYWVANKIEFSEIACNSLHSKDKTKFINIYPKLKWFSVTNSTGLKTIFNAPFMELTEINTVQNLSKSALINKKNDGDADIFVLALYGLEKKENKLFKNFWMFNFWKLDNKDRFLSLICNQYLTSWTPQFMKFSPDKKWLAIAFEYEVLIYKLETQNLNKF